MNVAPSLGLGQVFTGLSGAGRSIRMYGTT
jgi:hypothetical protein